jgi:hypothetical protein
LTELAGWVSGHGQSSTGSGSDQAAKAIIWVIHQPYRHDMLDEVVRRVIEIAGPCVSGNIPQVTIIAPYLDPTVQNSLENDLGHAGICAVGIIGLLDLLLLGERSRARRDLHHHDATSHQPT